MPREPLLNYDELLAPIPGDQPAGAASTYKEIRPQLDELRREVGPERAAETKEDLKNPDWRGLERKARETLTETAKDLRVAGHLIEALVKQHGFAGAHDGLALLRRMTSDCWDRLHPAVDPEDPEVRAGPYNWLDDSLFGLKFPATLKQAPFLSNGEKTYSLYECRPDPKDKETTERIPRLDVSRAAENAPREQLQDQLAEVQGCLNELTAMNADLTAKLGADGPSLNTVRAVLEEGRDFLQQILSQRPDAEAISDKGVLDGAPGGGRGGAGAPLGRSDLYRQIGHSAQALRELEPHSPIPYLLLRAVELGMMPFPQLMQELIRDANVLTELKRELGIKEPPPAE
jgi:type VI secretion system protein ImpA